MLGQGTFAAAVVPGDHEEDAVGDGEVHALEYLRPVAVVSESDAFCFDHFLASKTILLYQGRAHKTSLK